MAKHDNRASVQGIYQLNENETLAFTVTVPNAYPDALSEAKASVLSLLHDGLADVIAQTVEQAES